METEAESTSRREASADADHTLCRFVRDPFPECYCMNLTGRTIGKMLLFCSADYRSCSIYRGKAESATPAPSHLKGGEQ